MAFPELTLKVGSRYLGEQMVYMWKLGTTPIAQSSDQPHGRIECRSVIRLSQCPIHNKDSNQNPTKT